MSSKTKFFVCPGCSGPSPFRREPGIKVVYHKVYSVRNVFPEHYCSCGQYWYTVQSYVVERRPRVGRPRLGKTGQRSPEAKMRRNAKKKRARASTRYRFTGTHLLENVAVFYTVPEGRYAYHKARYEKANKPWVEKPPRAGWRLHGQKKILPLPAQQALLKIYETPAIFLRKTPAKRARTPRKRSRTEAIERLENLLLEAEKATFTGGKEAIARYDAINERLQDELKLRARRDFLENPKNIGFEYLIEDPASVGWIGRVGLKKDQQSDKRRKRHAGVWDTKVPWGPERAHDN